MIKWIKRLDALIRFLAGAVRVIVAVLNALDTGNNHENPVEKEIQNRHKQE